MPVRDTFTLLAAVGSGDLAHLIHDLSGEYHPRRADGQAGEV
jgi:hypothetical protein